MRVAFFASGSGTTFQFLVESLRKEGLACEPALLVCTNSKVFALERAKSLGVPSVLVRRKDFADDNARADALLAALTEHRCDFVCLCGYLEMVPLRVVEKFKNRIINVHPALLPAFGGLGMYGMRVHEAVIASGARISGATVHLVDQEYDKGAIIAQVAVPVLPDDSPDSLAARVQAAEKNLYYGVLRLFAQDRVRVNDRTVMFLPPPSK